MQEINKDSYKNNLNGNKVLNNSTYAKSKDTFKAKLDELHSKDDSHHKQRVSVGQYYLV